MIIQKQIIHKGHFMLKHKQSGYI